MSETLTFGGRARAADYYAAIFALIDPLRSTTTLRGIAAVLNAAGLSTPSGLPWNRMRVSGFLCNQARPNNN